ncbi:MAG: hypothetical protein RQ731_09080 [Anaerosomatales bacterium]|nr:hypothetical protein [Anaerosomatales bacterium]MDT8434890.1 hypothetical protein [Anaerosomatales bacterium]
MDWQPFIDEGILASAPAGRVRVKPIIRRAWQRVADASDLSRKGKWEAADENLRLAFSTASHALVCYHYLDMFGECDFELAERFALHFYEERFVGPMFERARNLRRMMPLDPEIPEMTAKKVRNSIASASAYVALVECSTFRDDPVDLFSLNAPNWYIRQT